MKKLLLIAVAVLSLGYALPHVASAHEVYVLAPDVVRDAVAVTSTNPFDALKGHEKEFFTTLLGGAIVFILSFFISYWTRLMVFAAPLFETMKKGAILILRLAFGTSLILGALNLSLFGPEIPLVGMVGTYDVVLKIALLVIGVFITAGFMTRISAALLLMIYVLAFFTNGTYVFTYAAYPAVAFFLAIAGAGKASFDYLLFPVNSSDSEIGETLEAYGFWILRILYAFGIIFAAVYAKFAHSALALKTIETYNLTNYLHFDPLYIVMGALITEVSIGVLIFLGLQIRLVMIIFTGFLVVTLFFFKEDLWPHFILFGINIALFLHGYDRKTLGKKFVDEPDLEPVL